MDGHTVVFGGSFNPPHIGHQQLALYLVEGLGAQRVIVVPTASHADGKALAPFAMRIAWLKSTFEPLGARVVVSDIERRLGGTSYTHTTLMALRDEWPKAAWAFCVGSDLVDEVRRWHRAADLLACARAVVLPRSGAANPSDAAARTALGPHTLVAPLALPEVSSSEVRRRYVAGAPLWGLVPVAVAELLAECPPPW